MDDYQHRGFPWLEFIGMCVALLLIFGMAAMGAEAGSGGTTTRGDTTTVNILSNNRIMSPDTTIIVNSNNPHVTGNNNAVAFPQRADFGNGDVRCWDAAANAYLPCGGGQ